MSDKAIDDKVVELSKIIENIRKAMTNVNYELIVTSETKNMEPLEFVRFYHSVSDAMEDVKKICEMLTGKTVEYNWKEELRIPENPVVTSFNIDRFWFHIIELPSELPTYTEDDDKEDFYSFVFTRELQDMVKKDVDKLFQELRINEYEKHKNEETSL